MKQLNNKILVYLAQRLYRVFLFISISHFLFNFPPFGEGCGEMFAQPYGNEWIQNYDQQYYRIKITQDGLYRINYNTLANAGIPVENIDPRRFQIFGRGEELYIYVKGEDDWVFNPDDYIEFYAKRNDGWFDSLIYDVPQNQGNPYYSLFTDTAVYFLTFNYSGLNRRMTVEEDTNFTLYTSSEYCLKEIDQAFHSKYYHGAPYSPGYPTPPDYTEAEGWFDDPFGFGFPSAQMSAIKGLPTPNIYPSGPASKISIAFVGASDAHAIPDHHIKITFANVTIDTIFEGYKLIKIDTVVPTSTLTDGVTPFTFLTINDLNVNVDRCAVSYIKVKYPQTYDFGGATKYNFSIPDNPYQNKAYIIINNFNPPSYTPAILYDLTNHKRIRLSFSNNTYKALVPNSGGEKECYVTEENAIQYITSLEPVSSNAQFTDYSNGNSDFVIITHKNLMPAAIAYKNYRIFTQHNPIIVDIDELYDQFAYGIRKNPLAIRNFIRYIVAKWDSVPDNLFLLGKGYEAYEYRDPAYPELYAGTLVPSFGDPPSDILLSAGINDPQGLYRPAIPTGRLAARTPEQVQEYLDKVIAYESLYNKDSLWMKNVLHFGGGTSALQQLEFSRYLDTFKVIIEDTLFGGLVRTFLKTSSDPIQLNLADSIRNLITSGVILMTFFGHGSATGGYEIDIDEPANYQNYQKYPFLFGNSCLTGNIFVNGISSSEKFVLIADKGMIGFLATVSMGISQYLFEYGRAFYKHLSSLSYGEGVGKIIQNTIASIQNNNQLLRDVCLETTLHGDPAIKLYPKEKPDYMINSAGIYFNPSTITTVSDSFDIYVISTNLGRAIDTSFFVEIIRTFPNGETLDTLKKIPATYYKDTIVFRMPVDYVKGVGLNTLKVTLDAFNQVAELNDFDVGVNNNTTTVYFHIRSTDIFPVYPYEYAIVPSTNLTLKASTADPFAPPRNYIFQLDTSIYFNPPLMTYQVTHSGGVVPWGPITLPFSTDSIVYYWRVSFDSVPYVWRQSSFQYIPNKTGWAQAHFFQFAKDDYQYVKYKELERRFDFVQDIKSIEIQTGEWSYGPLDWSEIWYKINNAKMRVWTCATGGCSGSFMNVGVINPIIGEPWFSKENTGDYKGDGPYFAGGWHCSPYTKLYGFDFCSNWPGYNNITSLLNTVPDGYYVLAYTLMNKLGLPTNNTGFMNAFKSIGADSVTIASVGAYKPYVIFGRKGASMGQAKEVKGDSSISVIHLDTTISTNWKNGHILSTLIGPGQNWGSVHWRWRLHPDDTIYTDTIMFRVIGIKANGEQDTLLKINTPYEADSMDIYPLQPIINDSIYPYLKLYAYMADDSLRTPPQLRRWQVIYEGMPETALDPSAHFYFYNDTIYQGEKVVFSIASHNISEYDMDSLLIKYWLIDGNGNTKILEYTRHEPHPAGHILIDTIIVTDTSYTLGLNRLWIEVNPVNIQTGVYDQLEQYHFNNIAEIPFYVGKDITNPILDVTFDGIHIMDGDIVSAKPHILITLDDENPFLILDEIEDTALFRVWLKEPGSNTEKRIWFMQGGQEILKWTPATAPSNIFIIEYNPVFTKDGIYELIVEGEDKSHNLSGDFRYRVSFEVINEASITSVLNYPNPFSTSTRFVFILTGSEVPEYFKITIFTVTGRVVKEIMLHEVENIHIGRNITNYAWDGKDEYGDQLANGVYLYKITVKLNGETLKHRETKADPYFVRNYGKMYLMR